MASGSPADRKQRNNSNGFCKVEKVYNVFYEGLIIDFKLRVMWLDSDLIQDRFHLS